ncbi:hypothetical protein GCM10027610_037340 [Dactylosporangium cerinum]
MEVFRVAMTVSLPGVFLYCAKIMPGRRGRANSARSTPGRTLIGVERAQLPYVVAPGSRPRGVTTFESPAVRDLRQMSAPSVLSGSIDRAAQRRMVHALNGWFVLCAVMHWHFGTLRSRA